MSGYRGIDTGFDPMGGEKRQLTRTEWALAIALIVMGSAMMAGAIAGDAAPSWVRQYRSAPIAIAELLFAWTFWVRAREHGAAERFSPRALRLTALFFVFLAVATAVVSLLASKGVI